MVNILTDLSEGVKRLQKLNKDMSEVELREEILSLRELMTSIRENLLEKTERIAELEKELEVLKSGEMCPMCSEGHLKVVSSRPHQHFAFAGVQTRVLKCDNCGHSEDRMHDPEGRTKGK